MIILEIEHNELFREHVRNLGTLSFDNAKFGVEYNKNKDAIIIYCTLASIIHECIIFCDIVMFHEKSEAQQPLF
jgi:hypothetical protein